VQLVLDPAHQITHTFPSSQPAVLAQTFAALIHEYRNDGLVNHLKTLTTLGHVASVLMASFRRADYQNPRIVEVQELSAVCLSLYDEGTEATWSATFIQGANADSEYVQFVTI
jgi:hypothetical protein